MSLPFKVLRIVSCAKVRVMFVGVIEKVDVDQRSEFTSMSSRPTTLTVTVRGHCSSRLLENHEFGN